MATAQLMEHKNSSTVADGAPVTSATMATTKTTTTTTTKTTTCGINLLLLKILNAVAFVATLTFNYISSAGLISPYGVGTISRLHPTRITPASGAFAIWAYIYALQGYFIAYQFCWPKQDEATLLHGVGLWYISACVFNSLWICIFVQGTDVSMWLSTVVIVGLLSSLCKIYLNTKCWGWAAPRPGGVLQKLALDVHLSLYAGWVTVATIVNTTVALTTVWTADAATASTCSAVMLVVALLVNVTIVATRRDCVWGFVLTWAAYYIAAEFKDDATVSTTATVVAILIGIVSGGCCVHAGVVFFRGRQSICDTTLVAKTNTGSAVEVDETETGVSSDVINTRVPKTDGDDVPVPV